MNPNQHKISSCNDTPDPDGELLVWEKWIKIRKEETEHLAKKTGRVPAELAMNILEKVREDKERKIVLEHSQIEKTVGVRNTLWEQPQRLKQKNYCDPVYEVQRTRAELGNPRIIEHIGVPRHIQEKEKGLTGVSKRKTCTKLDSSYINYREKREKDLECNIKKIDPFRPEIKEIVVIGSKPKHPPKKLPPLPTINVKSNYETPEHDCNIYAIRINNTILLKDFESYKLRYLVKMQNESWHEKCDSWSYYFNCPINKVGRSRIFLQNLGTVTLRYCWKKIKLPFEDTQDPVFFFNKNENVIYPGQKQDVLLTFISSLPGSYSESWEMKFLNICFFDNQSKKLTINLYADSTENLVKIKKKIKKLKNIIYNNVLKNLVRDILDEIFEKATSVEPQIYPYKKFFLEAEMFVMKNPVCFYHQTEVMKLREIFSEMAPKITWDLSISTWRLVMMSKQFDDRMKYYEMLRMSHRECLKPWYEDDDLLKQKYAVINQLLGQMADKFDEEYVRLFEKLNIVDQSQERLMSEKSLQEQLPNISFSHDAKNTFYLHAYEHVANTMELCAGFLSSLDMNRWINFDFCQS
ncbi:unnamed protein product [Euphydryas editha]|uniref:MYCBP-associated protein n=1 Tax=Euphydryas editha TaxID=104508 RepID=A0AAU9V6J5_EUPED|nr:unnamed protein product [Euphydryas editha]